MTDEPCACGRTYPRMPHGIIGRLDDMIIVRGVKFYPGDVEALLRGLDGMGTEFRIILERQGELDQVRIEAECDTTIESDLFRAKAEQKLQSGLGMRVTVMPKEQGYFPLTQFKARRVIDRRPRHEQ
ncbi:MAG: phenylacetate--CoA ligase [gamma proteobacterium symbiont of Clathrolucina costata]